MLRCFLFRYSIGGEVIRWVRDDGQQWAQQVFVIRLPDGAFEHTEGDHSAVFYLPGLKQFLESGDVVEM